MSEKEEQFHLSRPNLKELIATRVLDLFSMSLRSTLAFAAVLLIIDAFFVGYKIISPEQRVMTEKVVITFIGATVVQVGAALAAIVVAVFNEKARKQSAIDGSES